MHFHDPVAKEHVARAFGSPHISDETMQAIYDRADHLRSALQQFVDEFSIDLLISENSSTIPMNIALGIAIRDLAERSRLPLIVHNHDFYWERERYLINAIPDILNSAFPPRGANIHHFVINTIMQRLVKAWLGIDAIYLPNVFDFENPPPPPDDFALSFRERMGFGDDDLIVLQPTRIIRRKAIEKGIELLRKLNDPRLIYVITGYEGDDPGHYGSWLREEADRAGIRYRFIGEQVGAIRDVQAGIFSLWDIYPHAHFITYPSSYEGFGNALIEALYFRKPLVVHTYGPYLADIKPAGVQAVEFTHDIGDDVLNQTRRLIDDERFSEQMVTHNYQVGLEHFSYRVLREKIQAMLARAQG
jgi:glycosyltransferase involved in cell wall biosynthesis